MAILVFVALQYDQKVSIHGLIQYKWPEHWLAFMAKLVFQMSRILLVFGIHERAGFPCLEELLSSANGYLVHHSPKGHFWCHYFIPCPWKCGFWYTVCHTFDILDQVICVIVLMAAILDAILNLTASARDPDCPHKFFYYQDQESKWGDIWLHTGPPSDPGLHHFICKGQTFVYLPDKSSQVKSSSL